jgi:hypothetical protein
MLKVERGSKKSQGARRLAGSSKKIGSNQGEREVKKRMSERTEKGVRSQEKCKQGDSRHVQK